jgi:hypothetical protein
MKTEYLLHQLENAIALRNHEHQTWLNIFFASFSTTSLLFVALFSGDKRDFWEVLVISVFGILITLRFKGIQERAFLTMKAYEEFSKLIESKIKTIEGDFCSYNIFRGNYMVDSSNSNLSDYCVEKPGRERNAGKARNSINQFYFLTIALWIILLIIFSYPEIVPYLTKCNCN